jgi:hypothetical protein
LNGDVVRTFEDQHRRSARNFLVVLPERPRGRNELDVAASEKHLLVWNV